MLANCTVHSVFPNPNSTANSLDQAYEFDLSPYNLTEDFSYSLGVLESCFTEDNIDINDFNITRTCDFGINITTNTLTVNQSCGNFDRVYIRYCPSCLTATIFLVGTCSTIVISKYLLKIHTHNTHTIYIHGDQMMCLPSWFSHRL